MKKTYKTPQITITEIQVHTMLSQSTIELDGTETNKLNSEDILVKHNHTDYNVWEDSWSK